MSKEHSGQFDKETNVQNFEWHRTRALKEVKKSNPEGMNRVMFNLNAVAKKHGEKAATELARELKSRR